MSNGMTVYATMSCASRVPGERFPEVFITAEGEDAPVSLEADFNIRVVTKHRTVITGHPPPHYTWADAPWRGALQHRGGGETPAKTTGEDNLKTLRLVIGSYKSIRSGRVVNV